MDAVQSADIPAEIRLASTDRELHYMVALSHRSAEGQMWDTLRTYGALRVYPNFEGTAQENIAALQARFAEREAAIQSQQKRLAEMADILPELERYYDRLSLDEDREKLRANLIATKNVTLMEGWLPAEEEAEAVKSSSATAAPYEIAEPAYDEDDESTQPPVAFKTTNSSRASACSPSCTVCRSIRASLIQTRLSRRFFCFSSAS